MAEAWAATESADTSAFKVSPCQLRMRDPSVNERRMISAAIQQKLKTVMEISRAHVSVKTQEDRLKTRRHQGDSSAIMLKELWYDVRFVELLVAQTLT